MTVYSFRDDHVLHSSRGQPERPARLTAVRNQIESDAALAPLVRVEGAAAPPEALERIHDPAYLDMIRTFCATGGGMLDVDTYATPESWRVVTEAAGDLLHITEMVCRGEATNGFALGRPPGHHARPSQAMGFCLLSNVAIAARHAQAHLGVERVMIVDTDVHHGNGTQEAFYDDPTVLVVSSHQADIYPGGGAAGDIGADDGIGTTFNLPVPGGTGDEPLAAAYRQLLQPLADRFNPDLVLVSAGYDAHRLDPLGGLALSVEGLTTLIRIVSGIADRYARGRLVLSLEGGYNTDVLAHGVAASLRVLLDPEADIIDPFGPSRHVSPDIAPLIESLARIHQL